MIDYTNLKFKRITLFGATYEVLDPQTPEELVYALENDLLNIGPNTKLRNADLLDTQELLTRLN